MAVPLTTPFYLQIGQTGCAAPIHLQKYTTPISFNFPKYVLRCFEAKYLSLSRAVDKPTPCWVNEQRLILTYQITIDPIFTLSRVKKGATKKKKERKKERKIERKKEIKKERKTERKKEKQ